MKRRKRGGIADMLRSGELLVSMPTDAMTQFERDIVERIAKAENGGAALMTIATGLRFGSEFRRSDAIEYEIEDDNGDVIKRSLVLSKEETQALSVRVMMRASSMFAREAFGSTKEDK